MIKTHIAKSISTLALLSCAAVPALSQGFTPAAMEQQKEERLWFHTDNAAGTAFDDTRNYSDVRIGYDMTSGNFHRPQQGEKEKNFNVGSEGFLNLKNAYVWGSFSFNQKNMTDAGYNASIADPYRVMPYYVADTHLSKWRNQYYDLQFRCATPVYWKHVAFGLTGRYEATLAAKQRDPRVDTRFYTLELKPDFTVTFGGRHTVGANFEYASIKEDSQMENVNAYVDQDYYELYGLGMATKGLGSGRTTNYFGDRVGGSLQYGFTNPNVRLLFDAGYSKRVENVEISFSTPKKDASVKEKKMHVGLNLFVKDGNLTHNVKARYVLGNAYGIQYLNQRDNTASQSGWVALYHDIRSRYNAQDLSLRYALTVNRGNEYSWKFGADMRYTKQADEYLLPVSTMGAEHYYAGVSVKRNQPLGRKMTRRLLVEVSGGYCGSHDGHYTFGGEHSDYPTATELMPKETAWLSSDYYRLGAALTYSQQVKDGEKAHIFAKACFDYLKTSDYDYDHRSVASFSVGLNF